MEYLSVKQYADAHGLSERTVRNWCAAGKIQGAFLTGKTWNIPTDASRKSWFNVGEYKRLPNEVGGKETCLPEEVHKKMKELLTHYKGIKAKTLEDIIDFHCKFERIHPFQDGNGRVGRLITFKECLANNIVPFIITDELKLFYYRGLSNWGKVNGYLTDTCLTAQDQFKALLDYFKVKY